VDRKIGSGQQEKPTIRLQLGPEVDSPEIASDPHPRPANG
jgi:hypothetical protein